ncbi:MAG: hypothetical protein JNM46_05140 [Anaerolineales bacterium]|nr:hypothetical protein [Anaerolineales bacterium]
MNKRNRSVFLALAAIIALACACPGMSNLTPSGGDQPPPTFAPISTIPPVVVPTVSIELPQNVLLSDDFSSDTGEMEVFSDGEGSIEIRDGVYAIRSLVNLWVWGRTDTEFSDTVAEFDTTLISGPANNNVGMGLYCRLSLREDTSLDSYMLAISGDGYYAILEFNSGSPTALVDWTYSDVINQGKDTNKIRATCSGNELTLEVNGVELASTNIPSGGATSGYLSLAAVSFESADPTAEVHFDNLIVSAP